MAGTAKTVEDLKKQIPGLAILTDTPGQQICQPNDYTNPKRYPGRARRHVIKTQYAVAADILIIHKFNPVEGSKHDVIRLKEDHLTMPDNLPHITPNTKKRDINRYRKNAGQYLRRRTRIACARTPKAETRQTSHRRKKRMQQDVFQYLNLYQVPHTPDKDIQDGRQIQESAP